jgi:uncharacterized protein (DUF697 family)
VELPKQHWIKGKLSDAAAGLHEPHEKARAVIFAAVAINAGMGAVPFGINMAAFVAVDTVMVALIGGFYGFYYTNEQAAALIKSMFSTIGVTTGVYLGVAKLFAESAKATGVAVLPFYVLGVSLDGLLAGGLTYAVGFTSKTYFEKELDMSERELGHAFRRHLREGRRQLRRDRQAG